MGKEQELRPCPFCGKNLTATRSGLAGDHEDDCFIRQVAVDTSDPKAVARWNRRSSDEQAEVVGEHIPSHGKLPWDQLGRDVREATIGERDAYPFDPTYHWGHQLVQINFNSLSRIVDKYRLASPPAVAKGGVTEAKPRSFWLHYDHQAGRWIVGDGPPRVVRAGTEVIHVVEVLTASLAVGDEGIREGERFPVTLGKVHQAIDGYVQALVDRQHGGVAQEHAFSAICEALGRSPTAELDARRRPTPPSRGEGE